MGNVSSQLPDVPPALGRKMAVRQAALNAGHVVEIQHVGKRFRITCPCGWSTQSNWTRKRAFAEVTDHVLEVGRNELARNAGVLRDESETRVADIG